MNPKLLYVDDEPRNLTVFEASMPGEWELRCFDSAVDALKVIKELDPWVIISDQKMPKMTGLEFLEIASQLVPDAVRIVVTGQTEEQTIVQLVRRAKIFDYISKPWDGEILMSQLKKAIDYRCLCVERRAALEELEKKNRELERANQREIALRDEIGAWTPASLVWAIKEKKLVLPVERNLIGITYDIIDSSSLRDQLVQDQPLAKLVLRLFSEVLLKRGGIRESLAGDSVYGHFGAVDYPEVPHIAAFSVAQEFRVGLRAFSSLHKTQIECGIALHFMPKASIQLHEVRVESRGESIVQKWIDTNSKDIAVLHRMEKLVHELPGTNIIMSNAFLNGLETKPANTVSLGPIVLRGLFESVDLSLIPSDKLSPEALDVFKKKHFGSQLTKQAA